MSMKAIVFEEFGSPDVLVIKDVIKPEPQPGQVLIQIKGFGINHAEMHMRKGEWAEYMPISGIECVGVVAECPGGEFKQGAVVASLMGGLGRTINGSYAQYTCAAASNVVEIGNTTLAWAQLAALPESYATAWTCLFRNLDLKKGQKLLIRGGTSAFGQAAINLAVQAGAHVTATTRNKNRVASLESRGVESVEIEDRNLSERLTTKYDAVLNLVGNSVLLDSLKLLRRDGRMCLAGFLGGLDPVQDFNPLLQMPSGVHFSFFGSFAFGQPGFPLWDVPLRDIVKMVEDKKFNAEPSKVFKFDQIREAHRTMEANEANGKMVVLVE